MGDDVGEIGDEVRRPAERAFGEPFVQEAVTARPGEHLGDQRLMLFRGRGAERQRDVRQAEFEQPVAAP